MKTHFSDQGSSLSGELFHIIIAAPNFKKRQLRFLDSSYGVVSTDLDGALFNVNAAVSNA